MIVDELSKAVCCMTLASPGAELEGVPPHTHTHTAGRKTSGAQGGVGEGNSSP